MIGIDEVGRGAWAGPLLVVAVRFKGSVPEGLKDSKLLTRSQRQALSILIAEHFDIGEGWVAPIEIDKYGLSAALTLGGQRALDDLVINFEDEIILDGKHNYLPDVFTKVTTAVKADVTHSAVSAAAIWGKVVRDAYMIQSALQHPQYGFERHVGYGTAEHKKALLQRGALPIVHRFSFKPIKAFATT